MKIQKTRSEKSPCEVTERYPRSFEITVFHLFNEFNVQYCTIEIFITLTFFEPTIAGIFEQKFIFEHPV